MGISEPSSSPSGLSSGSGMVVSALLTYCVSGTLLTLANKLAIVALPAPYSLLFFQNGVTVVLLVALSWAAPDRMGGPLPPLTLAVFKSWLPMTLLFVGMLASSLLALQAVSAVTLIVVRNLCTLIVAFFESVILGAKISVLSVFSLLGILLGAVLYGFGDINFSLVGYAWLTVNAACTAAFQIYLKSMASANLTTGPTSLSHFAQAYYNNVTSLPLLALVALGVGEVPRLPALLDALSAGASSIVIVSALLGFALSTSAFLVNKLVSATSMMVANNVNKFALIILSEFFVQWTIGTLAAVGTALVLVCAWMYAQSKGPWASSGWAHDAFAKLGFRGLIFIIASCSFVAAVFLSSSADLHNEVAHVVKLPARPRSDGGSASSPNACSDSAKFSSDPFYCRFVPKRVSPPWVPKPGVRREDTPKYYFSERDWASCPEAAAEPGFRSICNVEGPCSAPRAVVRDYDALPSTTASGERVQQAIQRSLRAAWGADPPQIDLYFRAGCMATTEIAYLLPTIELFWPDFLGEIIIALDAGNHLSLDHFLPTSWNTTSHSYRFVFEDVPCLPPRVFNQVSYLNLDMHSNAEYIVTIDSDCAFHSPVTPDLLFDEKGKLLLARSALFQPGMWDGAVEFFTGPGTFDSHTMVTQPVAFARETFSAYREWMKKKPGGECYFDSVARFVKSQNVAPFCWMCQLGTFMQITGHTLEKYNMVNVDDMQSTPVYQRFAIHTYADVDFSYPTYGATSFVRVRDGLCRALGADILPGCADISQGSIDKASFTYATFPWPHQDQARIDSYVLHFRQAEQKSRNA